MNRNWLAVASAEHVEIGRSAGFMQVCHGKASPLRRVQPGDRVVYYSPNRTYTPSHAQRGKDRLQAFTAIGTVITGDVYQAAMTPDFKPHRMDVQFAPSKEAPIKPLVERLSFIKSKSHWGAAFRFGQVEITADDFALIAENMGAARLWSTRGVKVPDVR